MTGTRVLASMLAFAGAWAACGSEEDEVDAAGGFDSGPPADAAGSPDAFACNGVAQTGPSVTQVYAPQRLPDRTGGVVPDGTFHLIADVIYTGVGGASGTTGLRTEWTNVCASQTCEKVQSDNQAVVEPIRESYTFEITGATVEFVQTCPDDPILTFTFEWSEADNTVTLYDSPSVPSRALVFELQE